MAASRSIEELCKLQTKHAKLTHWLADSDISSEIFERIGENNTLDLCKNRLSTKDDIIQGLKTLIMFEKAYALVECSTLNFSTLWKYAYARDCTQLYGPPDFCRHYEGRKVKIYGPDHDFIMAGYIREYLIQIDSPAEDRLCGKRIICKTIPNDLGVATDRDMLDNLKNSSETSARVNEGQNLDIVGAMLNFHQRKELKGSSERPEIELSNASDLDKFARQCLASAVEAKARARVMLPFIVCNSVWTNQTVWLRCLIDNIIKHFDGAQVRILVTNGALEDCSVRVSRRLVSPTQPDKNEIELDYLIVYPVCLNYHPVIFDFFNEVYYKGQLINPLEMDSDPVEAPLLYRPIKGLAKMSGCSPYNEAEAASCLESVAELVGAGVEKGRIGVLTTFCAQKKIIQGRCTGSLYGMLVGIPEDFEYKIRDYLIISTVETAERTSGGKRYVFSDLLYDRLCLNLALTRATTQIIVIGDKDVLNAIPHWKELLEQCMSEEGVKLEIKSGSK